MLKCYQGGKFDIKFINNLYENLNENNISRILNRIWSNFNNFATNIVHDSANYHYFLKIVVRIPMQFIQFIENNCTDKFVSEAWSRAQLRVSPLNEKTNSICGKTSYSHSIFSVFDLIPIECRSDESVSEVYILICCRILLFAIVKEFNEATLRANAKSLSPPILKVPVFNYSNEIFLTGFTPCRAWRLCPEDFCVNSFLRFYSREYLEMVTSKVSLFLLRR